VTVQRNTTTEAVEHYPDAFFDFVYIDARHDYRGAFEDIKLWWPKMKKHGIMAGDDFTRLREPFGARSPLNTYKNNYTVNSDGTLDEQGRMVQGAVRDFFSNQFGDGAWRQVVTTRKDFHDEPGHCAPRRNLTSPVVVRACGTFGMDPEKCMLHTDCSWKYDQKDTPVCESGGFHTWYVRK
jgi:hypothetical protein